jgi:hypothetical protein
MLTDLRRGVALRTLHVYVEAEGSVAGAKQGTAAEQEEGPTGVFAVNGRSALRC